MLTPLAPDVWSAEAVAALPGCVRMPIRMLVVRLPNGLWLHSPVPIDEGLAAEIQALGPVTDVVAPSALHDLHSRAAHQRWPDATLHAAPSLITDRGWSATPLSASSWGDALTAHPLRRCPRIDEHAFWHAPTRTLIVSDLLFHVRSANLPTRAVLTLTGTWGRLAASRVWWWSTQDRRALGRSLDALLALPIHRLAMGHGDIVEDDAAERFADAVGPLRRWAS